MNVAVSKKNLPVSPIEDVQGHVDTRRIPINKVGIKDIFHPVKVKDRARGEQQQADVRADRQHRRVRGRRGHHEPPPPSAAGEGVSGAILSGVFLRFPCCSTRRLR